MKINIIDRLFLFIYLEYSIFLIIIVILFIIIFIINFLFIIIIIKNHVIIFEIYPFIFIILISILHFETIINSFHHRIFYSNARFSN